MLHLGICIKGNHFWMYWLLYLFIYLLLKINVIGVRIKMLVFIPFYLYKCIIWDLIDCDSFLFVDGRCHQWKVSDIFCTRQKPIQKNTNKQTKNCFLVFGDIYGCPALSTLRLAAGLRSKRLIGCSASLFVWSKKRKEILLPRMWRYFNLYNPLRRRLRRYFYFAMRRVTLFVNGSSTNGKVSFEKTKEIDADE